MIVFLTLPTSYALCELGRFSTPRFPPHLHSAGVGGGPEIQGADAEALGPLLGGQSQTSHSESTHEGMPFAVSALSMQHL